MNDEKTLCTYPSVYKPFLPRKQRPLGTRKKCKKWDMHLTR